jgi:hypothetical protein
LVLIGEAGNIRCAYKRIRANSQRRLEVFADFFFHCSLPIGGVRITAPRETKEQAKRGHLQAVLRLLLYNSPINCCTTRNRNMCSTRQQRIKKSKQCPVPQSQSNTQRLALFYTHHSFRWTLPLMTNLQIFMEGEGHTAG